MENISLIIALAAFAYSTWTYFQTKRESGKIHARMREAEDRFRSRFTEGELKYFDRLFEQQGIARKN